MSKLEQVLVIEPANELTFVGPFHTAVSSMMTLSNPAARKVCFKIKTTAPKRYCVKPNSGVIDPKQTVQIAVSLQPFEYDPQEKNRHKFMVQAMYAPDGDINQDTLWKETDGSQLMDSKLKCVFVMPEENSMAANVANASANGASTSNNDYAKPEYHQSVSNASSATKPVSSSSPKVSYSDTVGGDGNLRKSVEEIKKLQEEVSSLRQENLQLKEEALRQKRLASNRSGLSHDSSLLQSGGSETLSIQARSPDATALSTTYIYAALVVLVIGILIGRWIF